LRLDRGLMVGVLPNRRLRPAVLPDGDLGAAVLPSGCLGPGVLLDGGLRVGVLPNRGLRPTVCLNWNLRLGILPDRGLRPAIGRCLGPAVLLGQDGAAPQHQQQREAAYPSPLHGVILVVRGENRVVLRAKLPCLAPPSGCGQARPDRSVPQRALSTLSARRLGKGHPFGKRHSRSKSAPLYTRQGRQSPTEPRRALDRRRRALEAAEREWERLPLERRECWPRPGELLAGESPCSVCSSTAGRSCGIRKGR
jgi:hypothetical protein